MLNAPPAAARLGGLADPSPLSVHVTDIERCLVELDAALVSGETLAIDSVSQRLHRSLADSLAAFRQALQSGREPMSAELRQRLRLAQTRVSSQQAMVQRAGASIERTLSMLLPREAANTYGALGNSPAARALGAAYRG